MGHSSRTGSIKERHLAITLCDVAHLQEARVSSATHNESTAPHLGQELDGTSKVVLFRLGRLDVDLHRGSQDLIQSLVDRYLADGFRRRVAGMGAARDQGWWDRGSCRRRVHGW